MRWSKSVSLVAFVLVVVLIASGVGASVWAQSGGGDAVDRIAPPGQVAPPCAPLEMKLNTGQTPIGTVDTNWKLVSAPQTAASPPARAAYSVTPYSAWFTPSSGSWISPFPRDYIGPAGNYVYENTFSVSSSYTNIQLHIDSYAGDNQVRVTDDNVPSKYDIRAGFSSSGPSTVVPLSAGTHTLRATVTNAPTLPSQTGLLVAARVTGDCVTTPTRAPIVPPAPTTGFIIVDKVTIPAGATDIFNFTTNYKPGSFSLTDAAPPNNSGPLTPGTYAVSENTPLPIGWALISANCSDGSPVGAIVLSASETVTCTFTNRKEAVDVKPGRIIVDKVTFPAGDPTAFQFTASYSPGSFSLTDVALPNDSGLLPPNTYVVSEIPVAGWTTSLACADPDGGTTQSGASARIDLDAGETIICTFTNRKEAVDVKRFSCVLV